MDQNALIHRNGGGASSPGPHSGYLADAAVTDHAHPSGLPSPLRKGHSTLFWGLGGTVLSAVGFIALALFEQYNGMISELRSDLKHFNETSSEFVKRDSFQRLRDQTKEHFKEVQEATGTKAQIEHELMASEKAREEVARELHQIRERLAFVEGQQAPASNAHASNFPKK
jgi:septal ring factor EnvC (AmiA/AmiB activator)